MPSEYFWYDLDARGVTKCKIIPEIIELHWLRLLLCEDFRVERNKMFFVRYFLVSELNIHK